jgi:hypothetical protein
MFILEEGDLTDEALSIFLNRHQHRDILHLPRLCRLWLRCKLVHAPPEMNAIEMKMGRNVETQREPGMHRQALSLLKKKLTWSGWRMILCDAVDTTGLPPDNILR